MLSEWQTHKGKQIFISNYAGLELDALEAEMEFVCQVATKQPLGSMLTLTDVRGIVPTRQVLDAFMRTMSQTKKHLRKSAVIGIGFAGKSRVLFDAVMRITEGNLKVFDDIEQAKDWLVI